MKILLSFVVFILSLESFALDDNFLSFGASDFQQEKSHWTMSLGANYMEYVVPQVDFSGTHQSFKDEETLFATGTDLQFGREFHISGGFSTSLKLGALYFKNFQDNTGKASESVDIDLASEGRDYVIQIGQVGLSFNYLFTNEVVNFQPFVEFMGGSGSSDIRRFYTFRGIDTDSSADDENYNIQTTQDFSYSSVSLGINFISKKGLMSYLKLTQTQFAYNSQKQKGEVKLANASPADINQDINADDQSILAGSIGIGYLF